MLRRPSTATPDADRGRAEPQAGDARRRRDPVALEAVGLDKIYGGTRLFAKKAGRRRPT
jgi:hypothetical protein